MSLSSKMHGDYNMKIVVDAGHGGFDNGARYKGRREKDDTLALALAVGDILKQNGVDVVFTRTEDVYQTPYEKAMIANDADADYFVSLHRNAMPVPGTGSGAETLVYEDSGIRGTMARNINEELSKLGFQDLGVMERPNIVVLRRTEMPAVLVEAGFIDNDADNAVFDENFNKIAEGIAQGILQSITAAEEELLYRVNVGVYENKNYATALVNRLTSQGFPAYLNYHNGYYFVQVGAYQNLNNAIEMEKRLRDAGYATYIATE